MSSLFESKQILLIKGAVSIGDDNKVNELIKKMGFTDRLTIDGENARTPENVYSRFIEKINNESVVDAITGQINSGCQESKIGMFDFLIIDISNADMYKSIWHDGMY